MLDETGITSDGSLNPKVDTRVVPMRRVANPMEVARLALFLASDDSSYSSGGEFTVDGGMMSSI